MVNLIKAAAIVALATIAGCQTAPPETPLQELLDQGARAELAAQRCESYTSLRGDRKLRDASQEIYAKAREMGADQPDIDAARLRARQQAGLRDTLIGNEATCDELSILPPGY
ncbi:hypothetical protein [Martelella radicis]|uniref:Lipoprotein n=1 Tax=Martelella radicis TaxID=1397476 RepID=A0A7W6PC68_9HYPH|nr:hypothetical protein [Martelella radicis]MBB4123369.1 hypothetical protein [Martelella radicis]